MPPSAPVAIGNSGSVVASTTVTVTGSAAVPSGAVVLVGMSCVNASTPTISDNGSGGSLTYDLVHEVATGANHRCGLWAAQAPAGRATGVVYTGTIGAAGNNMMLCVAYAEGLDTSSVEDVSNGGTASASSYSSGNLVTTVNDELLFGVVFKDANDTNHASTAPATELVEFLNSSQATKMASFYRIVSTTGTYTLQGSWTAGGTTAEYIVAAGALKGAAAAVEARGNRLRRWL